MSEATHTASQEALDAQLAKLGERKPDETEKLKQAASAKSVEFHAQQKKLAAEKREKLLKVEVDRSQASALALEFEITNDAAITVLREQGGNLEAAYNHLLATKPVRPF